jgi:hypothetical protein
MLVQHRIHLCCGPVGLVSHRNKRGESNLKFEVSGIGGRHTSSIANRICMHLIHECVLTRPAAVHSNRKSASNLKSFDTHHQEYSKFARRIQVKHKDKGTHSIHTIQTRRCAISRGHVLARTEAIHGMTCICSLHAHAVQGFPCWLCSTHRKRSSC